MTVSFWKRQLTPSPRTESDVVIIGGGFVGLSTAYWLKQKKPDLRLTIIERGKCGDGASGRNAGFLTKGSANFYKLLKEQWGIEHSQAIFEYADSSIKLLDKEILSRTSGLVFKEASSRTLVRTEIEKQTWDEAMAERKKLAFNWIGPTALGPHLSSKFFGAYECRNEFMINPLHLLETIKGQLLNSSVHIVEDASAYEVAQGGVKTEAHFFKAGKIVLALNGYLPQFHPSFERHVTAKRAQMLAVELKENVELPGLYYDSRERVYWRKDQGRTLVIGGKRLLDEVSENSDFDKISTVIQTGLEDYLREQLDLEYAVVCRWSGVMGFTPHELPLVEKLGGSGTAYTIAGFSGHGMGLGFKAAEEMANLILEKQQKSFFEQFSKVKITL